MEPSLPPDNAWLRTLKEEATTQSIEPEEDEVVDNWESRVRQSLLENCFEEAARLCMNYQAIASFDFQKQIGWGYAKAKMVLDLLESAGIVGPKNGFKPRKVLIHDSDELESIIKRVLKNRFQESGDNSSI